MLLPALCLMKIVIFLEVDVSYLGQQWGGGGEGVRTTDSILLSSTGRRLTKYNGWFKYYAERVRALSQSLLMIFQNIVVYFLLLIIVIWYALVQNDPQHKIKHT